MKQYNKYSVFTVIPAYNEENRLPRTIKRLSKYHPLSQVIVVDDGSSCPVKDFLPREVIIARHRVNLGKGMALKTGCELAIKKGAKIIILMDADGQHDPKEIPYFLNKLSQGYDMVFGARYIGRGMPVFRLLGNRFLNYFAGYLFGLHLHDIWCGYRVFRAEIYPKISWNSSNYSSDAEMAVRVGLNHFRHTEHFVGTIYHSKGSVTGTTLHDGLKLLLDLTAWRLGFI
jgi:glycosyltransferase involved in cell wall biosynthesis